MPAHRAVRVTVDELGLNHNKPHRTFQKASVETQPVDVVQEVVVEPVVQLELPVAPVTPQLEVVEVHSESDTKSETESSDHVEDQNEEKHATVSKKKGSKKVID